MLGNTNSRWSILIRGVKHRSRNRILLKETLLLPWTCATCWQMLKVYIRTRVRCPVSAVEVSPCNLNSTVISGLHCRLVHYIWRQGKSNSILAVNSARSRQISNILFPSPPFLSLDICCIVNLDYFRGMKTVNLYTYIHLWQVLTMQKNGKVWD